MLRKFVMEPFDPNSSSFLFRVKGGTVSFTHVVSNKLEWEGAWSENSYSKYYGSYSGELVAAADNFSFTPGAYNELDDKLVGSFVGVYSKGKVTKLFDVPIS